jgi:hypothetical protein
METPLTASEPSTPSRRTSDNVLGRTWEMELLISGGVLFALFQVSAALDQGFAWIEPHVTRDSFMGIFLGYFTGKAILYILISSFVLHLAARGYWIGLIGLHSVFPFGPRWDQVKYGPITRRLYQERMPALSSLIARANDLCSVIFSFAAFLVLTFGVVIIWSVMFGLLALVISRLFLGGRQVDDVFLALLMGLLLLGAIAQALDKGLGERLDPARWPARATRGLLHFYSRLSFESLYRPIALTLFSNVRKKTIYPLYLFVVVALPGVFLVKDILIPKEVLSWSSYLYLPERHSDPSLIYGHYESQRLEGETFRLLPSIQDDVIRDPYVELFIPYSPMRHDPAVEKLCPGVEPLWEPGLLLSFEEFEPRSGSDPRAVLRCLSGIHRVALDGKPLQPEFYFYTHPRTGIRGILAYIPTAGLAKGRHLLRVEAVPRVRREKAPRPDPYLIRFWI